MCARLGERHTRRRRCRERTDADARVHRNSLELQVKRYGLHVRVLSVSGCLTGDCADRFCRAVRDQLALVPQLLVLEMARVATVDSDGVRALVHAARLAEEAAIRLALVSGASTAVGAALKVNGLAELFDVCLGINQAVAEAT